MNQQGFLPRTALPLLLCSGLAAPLHAESDGFFGTGNQLRVDPSLCVLSDAQSLCESPLQFHWQVAEVTALTVCLYSVELREALFCQAANEPRGQYTLQLPLEQSTRFELRQKSDQRILASATVTVARQLSDMRPRRRHGWGIF